MIDDDDNYQIDTDGNRVLIGLTADETVEFLQLDEAISGHPAIPDMSHDEWYRPEERRWLELYEKHETARRPFRAGSRTMH